MSDTNYSVSAARMNGVSNGIADPTLYNKSARQSSIMSTAIAQICANLGNSATDADVNALIQAIQNTFATTPYAQNAANAGNIINEAFSGTADFGEILLCQSQPSPAAPVLTTGSSGVLNGTYLYEAVFLTGYQNADGSVTITGMAPGAESQPITISNGQIQLTGIPLGTSGTVGRAIYRTTSGGSGGTEKLLAVILDNSTTTYTDNNPDSSLGSANYGAIINGNIPSAVPTSNTTGTIYYYDTFLATLLNGWVRDTRNVPVGYRKDSMGNVHLMGTVMSGTIPSGIFVLPAGYRPLGNAVYPSATGALRIAGEISIGSDGTVYANNPQATNGINYLGLTGIWFPTY